MPILLAIEGAAAQGVLWGVMVLGVYLTFRLLNVADLTVDGSFATGGAVTAVLILKGMNPVLTLPVVFIAGCLTGLATGFMNTKLKINVLLASILTQLALYSVNIRIMGKSNIPLLGSPTMMRKFGAVIGNRLNNTQISLLMGTIIVIALIALIYWFFGTEIGSAIRATGNNERMVRALGVNTDNMKILGLMLSNGLVALSGAQVAQSQGYADVGMGTGTIVIGLASIIIGEVIFGARFGFWYALLSVIFGSIIYRIVISIVLQLGLKSTDMKLLTALIVAISLSVPVFKAKIDRRRHFLRNAPENEADTRRHASSEKIPVTDQNFGPGR